MTLCVDIYRDGALWQREGFGSLEAARKFADVGNLTSDIGHHSLRYSVSWYSE